MPDEVKTPEQGAKGSQGSQQPAVVVRQEPNRSDDDLIPRRVLSDAQNESKKRKEKIKTLKADLATKDAEIARLKGLEAKITSMSGKLQEAEVSKVLSEFGELDDEAKGVLKTLITPHIKVNGDTFEVTKVEAELEKVKKVFGKSGENKTTPPSSKVDDVLSALYKRQTGAADPIKPKAKPLDSLREAGNKLVGKT